ncbi:glycosyltransferase family 2 protein [Radiobacillus deserti]|uniref:Glycosyltransferase family 2 protein n=1 Tax=Radiobacillus deserti TaxID=2594883 RepID=A0A516KKM6_9BACI|nr:glycosyltransferase [Radiobacillus deserti]QDP41947.1 glycosyltransferase family 2 protein [Radiobacillus deserti]
MLLIVTLIFFGLFMLFHTLYIFIPLYTSRTKIKVYPVKEKGFSILIPAYNETPVIKNCLMGILNLNYTNLEVLFINDGSTDDTMETFHKHLGLVKASRQKQELLEYEEIHNVYQSTKYPYVWVLDKKNGGKADSLNAGIDYAHKEFVVTLDADSILESTSIKEMNRIFSNKSILAAGGLVHIVQGFHHTVDSFTPCFKIPGLIRFQVVRYLTGFYMNKVTQSKLGSLTVIAGAFGAFRKDILFQVKGYRKTVGEDMDITLRIQELIGTDLKGKKIVFVPEAMCYTECPSSLKSLYKQRIRWQKAFIDCIINYSKSFYRKMNFKTSTFVLLDSLLLGTISAYPILFIPIIAILTINHWEFYVLLFSISVGLAMLLNFATLLVSKRYGHAYRLKDYISFLFFLPIEIMVYRVTEVIFVTFGTILYFFNKEGWSRSERIGKPVMITNHVQARNTLGGE